MIDADTMATPADTLMPAELIIAAADASHNMLADII